MIDANSSNVDWGQRIAEIELDFDMIWNKGKLLIDRHIGEAPGEKLLDAIFSERENEHEPFNIVPIRGAGSLTRKKINQIIEVKEHMFVSRLWLYAKAYYERNNNSLRGFSCALAIQEIQKEIENALPNDESSREVYMEVLRRAATEAFTALSDELAKESIRSLDEANRQAALNEARKAFADGLLQTIADQKEPSEEGLLLAYAEQAADCIIGNK